MALGAHVRGTGRRRVWLRAGPPACRRVIPRKLSAAAILGEML